MNQQGPKPRDDRPSTTDADALDTLKRLLFEPEQKDLEQLRQRIDDLPLRAQDVSQVLPDAVQLQLRQGDALISALEAPVAECLHRSVQADPHSLADALFPVMGPAIRRAIAESLRGIVDALNKALEHSLSPRGIAWRIEAMRAGVPFSAVVLRHTLIYRVEQVFLIQPGSGLLMQHVADPTALDRDADAVSAMLTAIEDFVKDAFVAGGEGTLDTVDVGEHTVLLLHGPYALMACVIRGMPPPDLRQRLMGILEDVHEKFAAAIKAFDGDSDSLLAVQPELRRCLVSEERETDKRPRRAFLWWLLAFVVLLLSWFGYQAWDEQRAASERRGREAALLQQLESRPGVVVTRVDRTDGRLHIEGLRDPLAPPLDELVAGSGLAADAVTFNWRPYQDLSPPFALRRAQRILAPPPTVNLRLGADGVLLAEGVPDARWIERARLLAPAIPGINAFDDSRLTDRDSYLLQQARAMIDPPEGVTLRVKDGWIMLEGDAPLDWKQRLSILPLEQLPGFAGLDDKALVVRESRRLDTLVAEVDKVSIGFPNGIDPDPGQLAGMSSLADSLREIQHLAERLQRPFKVVVTGRTDAVGTPQYNRQLAAARARRLVDLLVGEGLPASLFLIETAVPKRGRGVPELASRRADVHIRFLSPEGDTQGGSG